MNERYLPGTIRILADEGSFASVRAAAGADREIDWGDPTSPDAAACTACFAALELAGHLALAGENDERKITLIGHRELRAHGSEEAEAAASPRESESSDPAALDAKPLSVWVGEPPDGTAAAGAWKAWLLKNKAAWDGLSDEGYAVITNELDGSVSWIVSGKSRSGVLYGAYALLEALGFRWFGLGRQGMHVPAAKALAPRHIELLDAPRFETRGVYSEHIDDGNSELLDWLGRSRINFASLDRIRDPSALKKRGIRICMGGHNILNRFLNPHADYPYAHSLLGGEDRPRDPYPVSEALDRGCAAELRAAGRTATYADAHPDWYGLVNGRRSFDVGQGDREGYGDNFCTTHPDAVSELCMRLTDDLIGGQWRHADVLNFWMLDNGTWCQCPRCVETGNLSYRMILLVHTLRGHLDRAAAEGRLKRRIEIIFPIYHETLPAPDRALPAEFDYGSCFPTFFPIERCFLHALDDAACTETNQELMANFLPWTTEKDRHYKGNIFVGEYYNVGSFAGCPIPFLSIMKHDIPFYYRSGVRHFHYMHLTDRHWGTLSLTNYQLYRMLWNPGLDADGLTEEYYRLRYGASAVLARAFYEKLEEAMRNSKYLKHYQYSQGIRHSLTGYLREEADELFPLAHMQYDHRASGGNAGISLTDTVELLYLCRRLVDKAIDEAEEPQVAARLLEDELRFSYLEDMVQYIYGLVRIHRFRRVGDHTRARRVFERVRRYAEALERNTTAVSPSTRFDLYDNGLKASWCEKAYERYKAEYEERASLGRKGVGAERE
ncbi:DUF4838 domain-containing protein [Cohnella hashimotonis]|uniref:DUF4838 domain-containing protein n=1 Tax=Cohnella hashimotonis TaxID=2826895 RepID=A0ABT6TT57_9BACL|nr:DUF4838 domain-containing protein [Cohnella hashimotonis]MDI4649119.1 DUF4838 domain-containing protein [Cohnella hashimotonis]